MRIGRIFIVLALVFSAASAQARLGESLADLKKRYGKPQPQIKKNSVVWFFDDDDERRLVYAVTLNDKGVSIGEGLKPAKDAKISEGIARQFMEIQLEPYAKSKTLLKVKPGESYVFGNQHFVCDTTEEVVVDDANGILVVWNHSNRPALMAVTKEMFN
jgi:hypothetical protein